MRESLTQGEKAAAEEEVEATADKMGAPLAREQMRLHWKWWAITESMRGAQRRAGVEEEVEATADKDGSSSCTGADAPVCDMTVDEII